MWKDIYDRCKRVCDVCCSVVKKINEEPQKLSRTTSLGEKYLNLGEKSSCNYPFIQVGEPILCNPNSYDNLKTILMQLKSYLNISKDRFWTYLGCDGPPYVMASRLIEADKNEFDWITLLPGLGHLNMSQVKGYFKVLDNICLAPLGRDILNFKSPKAYSFFKDCKDNHKAWEAFEVFLHGTMLELIYKYSQESDNVSAMGFMQWQHKINAPTVKLILQLVVTYGLGIYTQRVGDRNNDIIISDAGRYSFDDWFFGFNHPYYREIEYRDLQNKAIYPPQVKEQRDKNLSFSVTVFS